MLRMLLMSTGYGRLESFLSVSNNVTKQLCFDLV